MEQNMHHMERNKNSRVWSGLFLLGVGILLLGYKMGAPIPGWLFTWPVLLIAIGLLIGIKSKFQNPGSYVMVIVGGVFFADQNIAGIDFHNYIVPALLICFGLLFIMKPRRHPYRGDWHFQGRRGRMGTAASEARENTVMGGLASEDSYRTEDDAEYININAVFGGVKKNVQSRNFIGGEVISFMGGAEINFMQADMQQPVVFEVNNVFGGTKLIVPSHWNVKNEISAVFGGVEDKRTFAKDVPDVQKTITLKGTCVFGGVEVASY